MNRIQLEHIIRAASQISGDTEIVIVGSQAIHAQDMQLPPVAFQSAEADVYPRNHPERADEIDAAIGELSIFEAGQSAGRLSTRIPLRWGLSRYLVASFLFTGHFLPRCAAQYLPRRSPRLQRPCVDHRQSEAAGRHGMMRGVPILVEGDLHAGNPVDRARRVRPPKPADGDKPAPCGPNRTTL